MTLRLMVSLLGVALGYLDAKLGRDAVNRLIVSARNGRSVKHP